MPDQCPFSGKPCGKATKAQVKLTTQNGVTTVQCCEDCADRLTSPFSPLVAGGNQPPNQAQPPAMVSFPFHPLMMNPFAAAINAILLGAAQPGPTCRGCGRTLRELHQGAKLGCPQCYEDLGPYIKNAISDVQEGASCHHRDAKRPKAENKEDRLDKEALKAQMAKAVAEERYEDAAEIRDLLRKMNPPIDQAKVNELERLMAAAVAEERYKDAAKFRDELKELKAGN